jgi:hypothetical protein
VIHVALLSRVIWQFQFFLMQLNTYSRSDGNWLIESI